MALLDKLQQKIIKYFTTANTDNMGKLFVTLFAFAPAPKIAM
jgi:hypothetical protein